MHYTQQDGRRYHYISDPMFEELFAVAEEWEYANGHPGWAESKAKERSRTMLFDSGDDVAAGDFEMRAVLYDWNSGRHVLETMEVLRLDDGEEIAGRRWYAIPEEKYLEWKERAE